MPADDGMSATVARWQRALVARVGLSVGEAENLLVALKAFCARHRTDPDAVLAHWETSPELTVRRNRLGVPGLAVESFLVHDSHQSCS